MDTMQTMQTQYLNAPAINFRNFFATSRAWAEDVPLRNTTQGQASDPRPGPSVEPRRNLAISTRIVKRTVFVLIEKTLLKIKNCGFRPNNPR